MRKYLFLSVLVAVICIHHLTGQQHSIVILVRDSITRSGIADVNVSFGNDNRAITDTTGKISLPVSASQIQLHLSHIGYQKKEIIVPKLQDTLVAEMVPKNFILEQVTIGERYRRNNLLTNSFHQFKAKEIRKIPGFLGEKDIIKGLQYLPGVYNPSEANTGLFVRGGTSDQTRIYLNGAPLFNPSHLYNFLSTFNPDIIQSIDFYKGGIPVEFGNAGSSIVDIRLRKPGMNKLNVGGAIGLLTSHVTLDGPVGKRLSFLISARRTYADVFFKLIEPDDLAIEDDGFHFYDINAAVFYDISTDWRVTMQGYKGSDFFNTVDIDDQQYGNLMAGLNVTGNVSDRSVLHANAFYTRYDFFDFNMNEKGILRNQQAGIHLNMTTNLNNSWMLNYGLQSEWTFLLPYQRQNFKTNEVLYTDSFKMKASFLNALYTSLYGEWSRLSWEIGLRMNHYQYLGPGKSYTYFEYGEQPFYTVKDTLTYSKFEPVRKFVNVEPRASLSLQITERLKAVMSYDLIQQYQYYFSRSDFIGPWTETILADKYLKPIIVQQTAMGLTYNDPLEVRAEVYMKHYENVLSYRDRVDYFSNRPYEQFTSQGNGIAKGLDIMIKKSDRYFHGWISYSIGKVQYTIDGVNQGKPFHPAHDIRHKMNILGNYVFNNQKFEISLGWSFHTGAPVELPDGFIEYEGLPVVFYDDNNRYKYRKRSYHRADVSFSIIPDKNKQRSWKSKWEFSVYNFYGRKNPLYYDYLDTGSQLYSPLIQGGLPEYSYDPKIFYLFYITPSVTYKFKF